MTTEELKDTLRNSEKIEINDRFGKYYQTKLYVAYNSTEAWTFHLTYLRNGDELFMATKVLPYFVAGIYFEDIPSYVLTDMVLDWSENICKTYGTVPKAMEAYKNS